jgi:hypothetical protein
MKGKIYEKHYRIFAVFQRMTGWIFSLIPLIPLYLSSRQGYYVPRGISIFKWITAVRSSLTAASQVVIERKAQELNLHISISNPESVKIS